jgi:spectinomycin phosphotransferase
MVLEADAASDRARLFRTSEDWIIYGDELAMLEPPKIADTTITSALREHYGIAVAALTFLPIGNDSASGSYRVEGADGAVYFLKTRSKRGFSAASVAVPRALCELGVPHIPAPMLTTSRAPWIAVNDFALMLYPFIEGRVAGESQMSEQHWIALGRTIKQIHTTQLPPELMQIVPGETFVPSRRGRIDELEEATSGHVLADAAQRQLAEFWRSHCDEIRTVVSRADALGARLRDASLPRVLCHADLHIHNVLLERSERWWLVDWDETTIAPKERDLMFFIGGIGHELLQPHDTELFLRGYGDAAIDRDALAYYRCAWAAQDVASYGEEVFFMPELGEESRRFAVGRFMSLFEPGNMVAIALAGDRGA